MTIYWKTDKNGNLHAYDRWTNTDYSITAEPDGQGVNLNIICRPIGSLDWTEAEVMDKHFATVKAAKTFVTKNFA